MSAFSCVYMLQSGCMHTPLPATYYVTKMAKNSTTTGCFRLIALPIVVFTMFATLLMPAMVDFYVSVTVNRVLEIVKSSWRQFLNTAPMKIYYYTCYLYFSAKLLPLYCPGGLPFHSEWTAVYSSFILLPFTHHSNETLS